jgi:hypothetical protein
LAGGGEAVPSLEDEAPGAILAILPNLFVIQDAEGFGWVVRAPYVGGIEDVAEVVARDAVKSRDIGVEFSAMDPSSASFHLNGGPV